MSAILHVHHLSKHFGGVAAVDDCTFDVQEGTITGLIGPNGAGKTTTFNLITGVLKPDQGEIYFRDRLITGLSPDRIARLGLVRTFQIPRVFARMTVWENLMYAVPHHPGERVWKAPFKPLWVAHEKGYAEKAHAILEFLGLAHLTDEYAGTLSGGQRKLLELGRVLMMDPQVILLDEPMAGVNPTLRRTIIERIHELNEQGITFLIVEHDMEMIMSVSDEIVVMHYGHVLAAGKPEEVRRNPLVLEAYLGGAVI